MCLTIFGKKPNEVKSKIAKKDIVCYKVLEIRGKNLGRYIYFVTPYKEKKIELNKEYADNKEIRMWEEYSCLCRQTLTQIGQGVFHTFAGKMDAFAHCQNMGGCIVVKCIIPKGSEYYVGDFVKLSAGDMKITKSYGSKNLIITSEIEWLDSFFLNLDEHKWIVSKQKEMWKKMVRLLQKKHNFDAELHYKKYINRVNAHKISIFKYNY